MNVTSFGISGDILKALNSRQQNIQIRDLCFAFYNSLVMIGNTLFMLLVTYIFRRARISGTELERVCFLVTIRLMALNYTGKPGCYWRNWKAWTEGRLKCKLLIVSVRC